jgi:hypothetical protein
MAVSPEILSWARDTAGLTLDQAAHALAFQDTRQRSAVQRLMALEAGDEQPGHEDSGSRERPPPYYFS